jgi:hypothetical protein
MAPSTRQPATPVVRGKQPHCPQVGLLHLPATLPALLPLAAAMLVSQRATPLIMPARTPSSRIQAVPAPSRIPSVAAGRAPCAIPQRLLPQAGHPAPSRSASCRRQATLRHPASPLDAPRQGSLRHPASPLDAPRQGTQRHPAAPLAAGRAPSAIPQRLLPQAGLPAPSRTPSCRLQAVPALSPSPSLHSDLFCGDIRCLVHHGVPPLAGSGRVAVHVASLGACGASFAGAFAP